MAAGNSQLSENVFTAGAAPDYLAHYAEILRSLPNPGLQFQQSAAADAQRSAALAQYNLSLAKAKAFYETYPAWKKAQIAKYEAEANLLPIRGQLYQAQANRAQAYADQLRNPPTGGADLAAIDAEANALAKGPSAPAATNTAGNTPGAQTLGARGTIDPMKELEPGAGGENPTPNLQQGFDTGLD